MVRDTTSRARRRTFLKSAVALSGVGIAGCVGSGSGGGENTKVTITEFPVAGVPRMVYNHVLDEGILKENMNDVGYDPDVNFTFTGSALLLSGESQIAGGDFSALDAGVAAKERDMDFAITGKTKSMYIGLVVRKGSEWHPDQTGSVRASVDKVVEEDGKFGIGSWGGVDALFAQILMDKTFGYDFSEDGDFNVNTAEYPAVGTLVKQGELAMASHAPVFGPKEYMEGSIEPILTYSNWSVNKGWGLSSIGNFISTREWAADNSEAIKALVRSYEQGIQAVLENPIERARSDSGIEAMGVETADESEYVMRFSLATLDHPLAPIVPPIYADIRLNERYIARTSDFLDISADAGFVENNWRDSLTFRKFQDL